MFKCIKFWNLNIESFKTEAPRSVTFKVLDKSTNNNFTKRPDKLTSKITSSHIVKVFKDCLFHSKSKIQSRVPCFSNKMLTIMYNNFKSNCKWNKNKKKENRYSIFNESYFAEVIYVLRTLSNLSRNKSHFQRSSCLIQLFQGNP